MGDLGSISGSGRSTGERTGKSLHILAWRITCSEEPGWLQSMGSQRVGHDWAIDTQKLETTQMFAINWLINKQTVIYSLNGMFINHQSE